MRLLLGNTLVFALGGLAVKAVSLVLMPLYTTALTAGEYGTAELLNSAIEIVLPLLSAGVVDSVACDLNDLGAALAQRVGAEAGDGEGG